MIEKNNKRIRTALKNAGITMWELADRMSVSEMTVVRKFRHELGDDERENILSLIEQMASGRNERACE